MDELLLFDETDSVEPSRVIALDPTTNRTFHYWHVAVPVYCMSCGSISTTRLRYLSKHVKQLVTAKAPFSTSSTRTTGS